MSAIANVRSVFFMAALAGVSASQAAPTASSFKEEVKAGVEEIFVFRTTRTRRTTGATPACASAPFPSVAEDFYDLWSVQMRASDARIVDTHKSSVGGFTACFGQAVQGQPLLMYATGTVARIPWAGTGECNPLKSQPPVRTVAAFNCILNLSGLPEAYAGGFLASSTVAPIGKGLDPTAHVPGYLSTSVVTLRLWRKPAAEASAPPAAPAGS
jgi:hypothetical protein